MRVKIIIIIIYEIIDNKYLQYVQAYETIFESDNFTFFFILNNIQGDSISVLAPLLLFYYAYFKGNIF